MSRATELRTLLDGEELVVAPGVYDGISAQAVRRFGFRAAYMTGAGVAATYGLPDVGLLTLTEMEARARLLADLLDVPLIADADTGYGSPINAIRAVRAYEAAGVAAIQLEDQVFPKRCGHLADKEVVSVDAFARTLQAALDARDELLVVARTDARQPHGLDAAIARGQRYAELGADVVFVEAPESEAELARIAAEIDAPVLFNAVEGGRTPLLTPSRLAELGFRLAIHPISLVTATAVTALDVLAGLAGTAPEGDPDPSGVVGLFELLGLDAWTAAGRRYGATGATQDR